jgi:hypothetical protein
MAISTSGVSVPQLGQTVDPSIYGNKEAPKGMSLSDLVNLNRSSIALQKEKALLEPAIEAGKAQSETAQVQAKKAKLGLDTDFADKMRQQQIALINHPLFVQAEQDPNFAKAHIQELHNLVDQQKNAAIELGLDPQKAEQLNAPYHVALDSSNGQGGRQFLKTRMIAGLDQQGQAALQPSQYFQAAPTIPSSPTGVTPEQMNQPPKSEASQPVKLTYPVRQAGQPYAALPQEEEERKIGTATKTALFNRQAEIPQSQRTIDRVIEKARELEKTEWGEGAGILGSAGRNLSTFLGTEQGIRYKEMSKDLANAQIANIQASGGSLNTDAGKQLVAMANGDVTYPPKVLIEIAQRTKADIAALDTKATAVKKFADKFGDQNISAFNQMWSKNADPDIFQLKNIFESDMSAEEKANARDRLIGNDPAKAKLFQEKWNNIKKLEQTGTL